MTLRTALVFDGDASGAKQAADQTEDGLKKVNAAAVAAARADQVRAQAALSAMRANQASTKEEIAAAVALAQKSKAALDAARAQQAEATAAHAAAAANKANTAALSANNSMTRQAVAQRANLIFQLNDIFVSLASGQNLGMVAIQQGSQISTIYGPGGLGKALKETGAIAVQAVTKFWPLAAVAAGVAVGVAGLTYEINRTRKGIDVSFGDTALAVVQTFGDYIWKFIKPAVDGISQWFADAWTGVTTTTSDVVNFLVREMIGAADIIVTSLLSIPDALTVAFEGAMQAASDSVTSTIQEIIASVNGLIATINGMAEKAGLGRVISDLGIPSRVAPYTKVDFGGAAAQDRLDKRWSDLGDRGDQLNQTDFAGQFFNDVADHAQKNALAGEKDKKAGKQSDYARELAQIRERTAALQVETNVVGLSAFAAEKARKTLELETAARKDSIGLTTQRIAEIEREATAYAQANAVLEQRKNAWQSFTSAGTSAFDSLTESILEGGKNIGQTIDDIIKDFAKLALQMAIVNPIKNALFGGNDATFSGLGGVFASLFGGGGFRGTGGGAATLGNVGSFAGGGYTGRGARSGGLDGLGGFIAMMHPQETVVDHAQGQSMGGVVINISNNAGADVSARQTGTDAAGRAIIAIAVNEAVQRVEGKMAKGNYRALGVGPGLKRA